MDKKRKGLRNPGKDETGGWKNSGCMKAESIAPEPIHTPLPSPPDSAPDEKAGFQRILVPTDFSPPSMKALHYAKALARGTVQLLHVSEPLAGFLATEPVPGTPSDEETAARLAADLEKMAEGQRSANLEITSTVRLGRPAEEIVKLAADWPADLLVLSTHGRTGLRHLLLGSVAEKVLRHTTCPLLVLHKHDHDFAPAHPGRPPQPVKPVIQRILVPTDFSARSREAIRFACQFAAWFGGKITLFHTVHIPGPFGSSEFPGMDAGPIVSAAHQRADAEIQQLLDQAAPAALADRAIVREGPPLDEIPKLAMEGKYDLIICATHSLAPLRHALLGSTAEGLVRHAICPVLVVPCRETLG